MAIDISHRQLNNNKRAVTLKNSKKQKKGLSFCILSIAAIVFAAAGLAGTAFSVKLGTPLQLLLSFIGQAAVPLSAFLTAQVYNHAANPRKTVLVLGILALFSHFPYVYLCTGGFEILSRTSLIFPLFMGCTGLMLSDMPNIDRNVKTILMLLICFAASVGDGGSAAAVWLIIFGSHYDRQTQTKLFYAAGFVITAINLIYGIMDGQWYSFIPTLGFLISVPFINNFIPFKAEISKALIYVVFYPSIIIIIALIKVLF